MQILFAYDGFPLARAKLQERLPRKYYQVDVIDPERPLPEQAGSAEVIIPSMGRIDREVIDAAPRLRLIVQYGVGLEGVDIKYACSRGVYVANTPGINAVAVAEHALFLMLALSRRLPEAQKALPLGKIGDPPGRELQDKTLGLVGLGNSGRALARMARGLDLRILAVRRHPGQGDPEVVHEVRSMDQLHWLLARSDFVSLHAPLTPETRGLIDAPALERMKNTAFLINVARGGLVDYAALLDALQGGSIAGAGLDVFWTEPPDASDPIFTLDNVVATPHIAGVTAESYERAADGVAEHILNLVREGKPLVHHCS